MRNYKKFFIEKIVFPTIVLEKLFRAIIKNRFLGGASDRFFQTDAKNNFWGKVLGIWVIQGIQ